MRLGLPVRRVLGGAAMLLLLALTWLGVSGGIRQIPRSHTPGELIQSVAQLSYGVFSLLGVLTRFRPDRRGRLVLGCWVASMAVAGGFAPVVWGGATVGTGLLSGGAVVLVALGIVWLLRAGFAV